MEYEKKESNIFETLIFRYNARIFYKHNVEKWKLYGLFEKNVDLCDIIYFLNIVFNPQFLGCREYTVLIRKRNTCTNFAFTFSSTTFKHTNTTHVRLALLLVLATLYLRII